MLSATHLPVLTQSHIFLTSDSSFQHHFFEVYFLFLIQVHLCFPVCSTYYQAALLINSRINFCIADLFPTPDLMRCLLVFVPCQFQFLSSHKPSCNLRLFPSYSYNAQVSAHISSMSKTVTGKVP